MMQAVGQSFGRKWALAGLSLAVLAGAALMAGCKGNTTAAAIVERQVGKPPTVTAKPGSGDLREADPLTSDAWKGAAWWEMSAPANTTHTTPRTRGAALYDGGTLYVAVVCSVPEEDVRGDAVTLYVDPAGQGRELLEVTAEEAGVVRSTWIRTSGAIEPAEDGGPNWGYPLDVRPNFKVAGLGVKVRQGEEEGKRVWTAVMAVPVGGMPAVMQVMPKAEGKWKMNVLRTVVRGGERGEALQANLSPVWVNGQAFCPYRMAEMRFGE